MSASGRSLMYYCRQMYIVSFWIRVDAGTRQMHILWPCPHLLVSMQPPIGRLHRLHWVHTGAGLFQEPLHEDVEGSLRRYVSLTSVQLL